MKIDVNKLFRDEVFVRMVERALAPFAMLDRQDVVIGIGADNDSGDENVMITLQTNVFYLADFKADEEGTEAEAEACCNTSCDCKHKGDGL